VAAYLQSASIQPQDIIRTILHRRFSITFHSGKSKEDFSNEATAYGGYRNFTKLSTEWNCGKMAPSSSANEFNNYPIFYMVACGVNRETSMSSTGTSNIMVRQLAWKRWKIESMTVSSS
jgi:hypothetical protein